METREAFLTLVRLGIGHKGGRLSGKVDWNAIRTHAEQQGLYAVVLDGIERLPENRRPPQEVLLEWIGEVLQNYEYCYEQYTKTISEMAAFYGGHGFKMMVLKGYTCSLNWPKPNHRPCGDIDIWQFGKRKEADSTVAQKKIEIDKSHHHHTVFNWGGFTVENHYDFVNVNVHKSSVELEKIFKKLGQDDSHYVDLKGSCVFLPSSNLHALFLIKHMVSHFVSSNVNLRQVLDWAFFVEKHIREIDWDWLNGMVEKYHMADFINCINAICVEELGFESSIFHGVHINPDLKDKVFEDIINPKYEMAEPVGLLPRLVYKYRRWYGNKWKQELCFDESRLLVFLKGLRAHLHKLS